MKSFLMKRTCAAPWAAGLSDDINKSMGALKPVFKSISRFTNTSDCFTQGFELNIFPHLPGEGC